MNNSAIPGSWKSPLTAAMLAGAATSIGYTQVADGELYWDEIRPHEGGRRVVVSRKGDFLPAPWDAKTSILEYGGLSWLVIERGGSPALVFCNKSDQRLYLLEAGSEPIALTPEPKEARSHRYAGMLQVGNEIWCIREILEGHDCQRDLVAINFYGKLRVLESSSHFYMHPRLSPDGKHLSWMAWEHPQMPWDGTEFRIADITNGELTNVRTLAGSTEESILTPEWVSNDELYYISDTSGWWNLWKISLDGKKEQIISESAEWGMPMWQIGQRFISLLNDGRVLSIHGTPDNQRVVIVDPKSKKCIDVASPFTSFTATQSINGDRAYIIAAGAKTPPVLVEIDLTSGKIVDTIWETKLPVSADYLTTPRAITVPGKNGRLVHAIMHPPQNPEHAASGPVHLLVTAHGGPTAQVSATAKLSFAYYTSRGIAVVDVNYGGSTGYGREYRNALRGQWGIMDYEDVLSVVDALVADGTADESKVVIKGGSAGGFTVLNALVMGDVFAAGASYYGVADCETLATDTHDFESRYLDSMIGPYPERKDLYVERSPITHAENLSAPLIIFQGLDDKVVPPAQSEAFRDVCVRKGIKHRYIAYEGEGHGFIKATSIIDSLESELTFFGEVLAFTPAL